MVTNEAGQQGIQPQVRSATRRRGDTLKSWAPSPRLFAIQHQLDIKDGPEQDAPRQIPTPV